MDYQSNGIYGRCYGGYNEKEAQTTTNTRDFTVDGWSKQVYLFRIIKAIIQRYNVFLFLIQKKFRRPFGWDLNLLYIKIFLLCNATIFL